MTDLETIRGKVLARRLSRSITELRSVARKLPNPDADRTDLAGRLQLIISDLRAVVRVWKDQDLTSPNPTDHPDAWGPGPLVIHRENPADD